jgi:hypothetical protein
MRKLIVFFLFLLILPIAFSFEWQNSCINNITLQRTLNYTNCNSTVCDIGNSTFYKDCEFGCDTSTQSCNSSPITQYLNIGIALLIIIFALIVIIKVAGR